METKNTETKSTTRSLARKLAEVMGEVDRVPKSGRNDFHKYDYATEADIVAAVRKALSDRRVVMLPHVVKAEFKDIPRKNGGADRLCTLTVRFTFYDGDSGEELSFEVLGEGQDAGDKATYKAMTGAVKYALLKTFLIPTGDDPEKDEPPPPQDSRRREQHERPRQTGAKPLEATPVRGSPPPAAPPSVLMAVAFGPHKGKSLAELSDAELQATIDLAQEKLTEAPKATWAAAMRVNLGHLEAEAALRAAVPPSAPREPGAEG